jgi:hypothetical protein
VTCKMVGLPLGPSSAQVNVQKTDENVGRQATILDRNAKWIIHIANGEYPQTYNIFVPCKES